MKFELTVWKTCPYVNRDGQFNPDGRFVNDVGNFGNCSEAVFYNTLAWAFNTSDKAIFEVNAGPCDNLDQRLKLY